MAVRLLDDIKEYLELINSHEAAILALKAKAITAYQVLSKREQKLIRKELSQKVWLPCDCFADDGMHKASCPRYITR